MTEQAHQNMLTTQYLDNWAYQANIRDYIYRMQQKLEAGTIKQYYPTEMGELQSRTKEQVQRYAQTYLGVDPKTVNVTFPWNRLFEVYVDVQNQPDVPLEADVRQEIKHKELQQYADVVTEAQKALEDAQKETAEDIKKRGKDAKATPEQTAKIKAAQDAVKAAQDQFDVFKAKQDALDGEELAQQNRTWTARKS